MNVELKPLLKLFKNVALAQGWCDEAEYAFTAATGVKFDTCSRFEVRGEMPETVPEDRIIAVLREHHAKMMRGCSFNDNNGCCKDFEGAAALQLIADTLPSKPNL